jgi:hypothetical protein
MHVPVFNKRVQDASGPVPLFAIESRMLKRYMRALAERERPEVLDLGPVSGNNISFFLGHNARLHLCDVFSRSAHRLARKSDADDLFSHVDITDGSLDGIHLWDMPDHIDNHSLSILVNKLHALLKPDGIMMMIASTVSVQQPFPLYFVIREDNAVVLDKMTTWRLPYFYRTNREIERCLKPFHQLNSFICTNGVREFLFKPQA